jgi:hypothetical protein
VLQAKERTPIPFSFVLFTFELAFESYEEFGGASFGMRASVKLDPPIGEFRWH